MSARREIYRVCHSNHGWLVQKGADRRSLGPFADKEDAIATALAAVREAKPSQLRISAAPGEWRVEFTCAD
jgi:hypothetical protein